MSLKPYKTKKLKTIMINPKAELKMRIALAHAKELEIMWFGEIIKNKKGNYILKDVHFPPQINYSAYVETDDERYPEWFFENFVKKGKQDTIRLHGHSHPYFPTKPSKIDLEHAKRFLSESGDYFIQLILSNSHPSTCRLYTEKGYEPVVVKWDFTKRIKRILKEMMKIGPKQTQ